MCMQAADVAHKAEVSELNKTIQRNGDQLKEKEVEIKKLMKSAEEKERKIQELKGDNEMLREKQKEVIAVIVRARAKPVYSQNISRSRHSRRSVVKRCRRSSRKSRSVSRRVAARPPPALLACPGFAADTRVHP